MPSRKFSRDFLTDVRYDEAEGAEIVHDEIVDTGRWSVQHWAVFSYEDKFYELGYDAPATEMQDGQELFWWSGDETECKEVEKVKVTKYEWKVVK